MTIGNPAPPRGNIQRTGYTGVITADPKRYLIWAISASWDSTIKALDPDTGNVVFQIQGRGTNGNDQVTFSRDYEYMYTLSGLGGVYKYSFTQRLWTQIIQESSFIIWIHAVSPTDYNTVLVQMDTGHLNIYNNGIPGSKVVKTDFTGLVDTSFENVYYHESIGQFPQPDRKTYNREVIGSSGITRQYTIDVNANEYLFRGYLEGDYIYNPGEKKIFRTSDLLEHGQISNSINGKFIAFSREYISNKNYLLSHDAGRFYVSYYQGNPLSEVSTSPVYDFGSIQNKFFEFLCLGENRCLVHIMDYSAENPEIFLVLNMS